MSSTTVPNSNGKYTLKSPHDSKAEYKQKYLNKKRKIINNESDLAKNKVGKNGVQQLKRHNRFDRQHIIKNNETQSKKKDIDNIKKQSKNKSKNNNKIPIEEEIINLEESEIDYSGSKVHDSKFKIFVGNLGFQCNESQLKKYFSDCGIILESKIKKNKKGKSKGYGYISFKSLREMNKALKKDQYSFKVKSQRI